MHGLNERCLLLIWCEVILRWLSYTDDETHSRMNIAVSPVTGMQTSTRLTPKTVAEGETMFAMQQI